MSSKTTLIVMLILVVLLVIWDLYLAMNGREGDTISEVITSLAKQHPMIPFTLGVLVGHWFFR